MRLQRPSSHLRIPQHSQDLRSIKLPDIHSSDRQPLLSCISTPLTHGFQRLRTVPLRCIIEVVNAAQFRFFDSVDEMVTFGDVFQVTDVGLTVVGTEDVVFGVFGEGG